MKKIIAVDGDDASLFFYRQSLKNHDLVTVSGALEALIKINNQKPDIVILNVRLSDDNGLNLAKEIKATNSNTRVIMISSVNTIEEDAYLYGCDEFHLKPISREKILEIIG